MPRQRSKNEKTDVEIYVILSSVSNEFYVGKTKNPNHYQAYKDHARLKNAQTKNLFSRSIEENSAPKMYLIEVVNATKTEAYSRCVLWTKYFLEHGYSPIAAETTVQYANNLNDENALIYLQIKNKQIETIICNEKLLVVNYEPRKIKKQKNIISICITPEEYDFIQNRSKDKGLTMSKYCKEMALNGDVVEFNSLSDYLNEIREIKKVLYEIQFAILQNGKYYPADLENLQKLVDRIDEGQKKVVKKIASYSKSLKRQRRS